MKQLDIQFFWPLTEQIPLDLDFSKSVQFENKKREEKFANSVCLSVGNGGTWVTSSSINMEPSFTIDVDQTPITVVSSKKPNFIKRWIYKTLGMKWKAK